MVGLRIDFTCFMGTKKQHHIGVLLEDKVQILKKGR